MSMVCAVHVDTLTLAEIRTTNTNALQVLKWVDGGLLPGEKRQESELQERKKKSRKERKRAERRNSRKINGTNCPSRNGTWHRHRKRCSLCEKVQEMRIDDNQFLRCA